MKAFFAAVVAMAVITVGVNYGLTRYAGYASADQTMVGHSVRLD